MLLLTLISGAVVPQTLFASCTSDLNCSLFGECRADGSCACDAGWAGPACARMQLLPVSFPQGYGMDKPRQADVNTSWGGNVIFSGGEFHMFVNAIANQCLLGSWMINSRIDHVVSSTAVGPYTFRDTAIGMTSSNPAPVVLRGGPYKYAIFHIYNGTTAQPVANVPHCFKNGSRMPPHHGDNDVVRDAAALRGDWRDHQISVSDSLDGPWKLLQPAVGNKLPVCNNPAPWVHPNGTLYAMCGNVIYTADSIEGPWHNISTSIINHGNAGEWPTGWHHEDEFLFTTKRGWHVLFHASIRDDSPGAGHNCTASVVSAHMFSPDGFEWHVSPVSPYGTQVEVVDGGGATRTLTVATRERPKLIFSVDGEMTHLINGVCGAPHCNDSKKTGCMDCKYKHWDFTLIQPIQQQV